MVQVVVYVNKKQEAPGGGCASNLCTWEADACDLSDLKVNLVYIASSRTTRVYRPSFKQNKQQQNKQKIKAGIEHVPNLSKTQ